MKGLKQIKILSPVETPPKGAEFVVCERVQTTKVRGARGAFWIALAFYRTRHEADAAHLERTLTGDGSALFALDCVKPRIVLVKQDHLDPAELQQ